MEWNLGKYLPKGHCRYHYQTTEIRSDGMQLSKARYKFSDIERCEYSSLPNMRNTKKSEEKTEL